jgi:hypothetical protein
MREWASTVKQAIEHPHFICADRIHPERNIYYVFRNKEGRYIKVVVGFETETLGYVISAFPTDSGKAEERMIWTKSSS